MKSYCLEFFDSHGIRHISSFTDVSELKLAIFEMLQKGFDFNVSSYVVFEVN